MGDPYILMLIALGGLAILDLVVGVSNDAVNFLNSAIGSKAFPLRTIMIIASVGVFFGAISSSGMMEVARKGIFNPNMFVFEEIMYIFMAVMITDVLLLDIFNSLGMPTSTTVSIVFELLGAAVAIALIKITANDSQTIAELASYINHKKAIQIISGILLSVVFAFSLGALVQYISRLLFTFDFKKSPTYVNVLFGGFAITSITFFIFFKGLKGTPFYADIKHLIEGNTLSVLAVGFVFSSVIAYSLIKFFKINILVVIIGLGIFSLAVAFSGNDLVNFIGVPMAAYNSYEAWHSSGVPASEFSMGILAKKVPSNTWMLLIAGAIMVITLWTSKKAKSVIETEINLARQNEGTEKFTPNNLSRIIVKFAITANKAFTSIISGDTKQYLDAKFEKPVIELPKHKRFEMPAFDLVRASVNLVMASILISIATSMKLPLSTTYVTFMVAMGSSLADRAWGRDSAVYRVAGVLSVIAGWFLTAVIAFCAAAIIAYLISWTKMMIPALLLIVIAMLVRNSIAHAKREKEKKSVEATEKNEIRNINGIIDESSDHIARVTERVNKLYSNVIDGLANENLAKLRKSEKHINKLNEDIDDLKNEVFYFIKSLDDSSVKASKFYILTLGYLQDITQSIDYISKASFKHINNNHKQLNKSQIKDLNSIEKELTELLTETSNSFQNHKFNNFNEVTKEKKDLLKEVNKSIEKQISRIRMEETTPKNSTLYFGILLETQDLISAFLDLLEMYDEFHNIAKQ